MKKRMLLAANIDLLQQIPELPANTLELAKAYALELYSQKELALKMDLSISKVQKELARASYIIKKRIGDPELAKGLKILYGRS